MISAACIVSSYLPLGSSNFLLQTSSSFWTLHLRKKHTGRSNRNFHHLPSRPISLYTRESGAKQEEEEEFLQFTTLLSLTSFVALALHLCAVPVLCQEDAGSKGSGERARKGMEFVPGESNGAGV